MSVAAFRNTGRALRASTRLGWIISSNWTKPGIFLVYALLKPMSAALILTVMYRVIAGDSPSTRTYLAFLVVGAAFWSFVQGSLSGFANAISEDRGRYRQLKYVYMSPQPFAVYLIGRGAAQLLSALASVVLVLAIATPLLHLPLTLRGVDWGLLLLACMLAFATVLALGMAVSVLLLGARDSYGYGEIIASTLYVVSGAIFPIGVLPGAVATLAAWLPLAYWLELVRRALLHDPAAQMFPGMGTGEVLLKLAGTAALLGALSVLALRRADRRARRLGLVDRDTMW